MLLFSAAFSRLSCIADIAEEVEGHEERRAERFNYF